MLRQVGQELEANLDVIVSSRVTVELSEREHPSTPGQWEAAAGGSQVQAGWAEAGGQHQTAQLSEMLGIMELPGQNCLERRTSWVSEV